MAKTAPPPPPPPPPPAVASVVAPAPGASGGSFANPINAADPRVRNIVSPPQTFVTASLPPQQAPVTAANPLAALAALLPQAQMYESLKLCPI
jgi:hypothetical protein